jgi:hypothetical protein
VARCFVFCFCPESFHFDPFSPVRRSVAQEDFFLGLSLFIFLYLFDPPFF